MKRRIEYQIEKFKQKYCNHQGTCLQLLGAEIILLDEATSELDNKAESIVQDALVGLSGRTVITIAHRLSTIKDSDTIYVIDNGTIAEYGTHENLMSQNGIYKSLQK